MPTLTESMVRGQIIWKKAIGFYEAALTVYTREAFPFENVTTLNNLGWTYLKKLDHINLKTPKNTNQRAATLQNAYNTFKDAVRSLKSAEVDPVRR